MRSSRPPRIPTEAGRDLDIGPYTLANRIAVGGMAEVFRALDEPPAGETRSVVIKRMLPDIAQDEECRRMFEHEGELGLRIEHRNVVRVLDRGVDGDTPYIVLEYVFGVDLWRLARFLTRTGETLRPPVAMYVMTEMLTGLDAVHSAIGRDGHPLHIEHRDVSPSNIFLSVHGDVKLGDLGIAVAGMRETHPSAPRDERGKGKLGYLAPEIVRGNPSDQRADVFSAGVVAAELIMGQPLFTGAGEIGVLLAIRDADVTPFREVSESLPPAMAYAILSALRRDPGDRVETAADLRDALLPFVDEPLEAVRLELGRLVAKVLTEEGRGQPGDRGALAETVEKSWPLSKPAPAMLDDEGRLHVQSDAGELVPVDDAASVDEDTFEVTTQDGLALGVFKLAELVEAIATRRVGPLDTVSINGADPAPVVTFPNLRRHLPPSSRTPTLQRRTQSLETTELFDLERGGMLAALGRAYLQGFDGLILSEHADTRIETYLVDGRPVYVASNRPEDLLGARLVAQGELTRSELDMALAVMPRFDGRLGETLATLGLVEPVRLVRHITAQVRERLLDTFTWPKGRAAFYLGVDELMDTTATELDPWAILEQGASLRLELGLEEARFEGRDGGSRLRATREADALAKRDVPAAVELLLQTLTVPTPLVRIDELIPRQSARRKPSRGRCLATVLLAMGAIEWA